LKAFAALRIVELAGSEAGAYATKLFADHGASVIRVEPMGGDPRRSEGVDWGGTGTTWAYLNTSKQACQLDLSSAAGRAALMGLLDGADAVFESASPDPLDPVSIDAPQRELIKTYISPFGGSGPYSGYRSNVFTDDAIGGHLYLNGEPDREPIRRPGLHAMYQSGTQAFIGTMAALRAREESGEGQVVEVSHFEGFVSLHQHTTSMWMHGGHMLRRERNRQPGFWHPIGVYRCRDGYVQISLPSTAMTEPFLLAAGLAEVAADPRFSDDYSRGIHKDEFDEAIRPWLMAHSAEEIVALGQSVFTPVGPVPGMLELVEDAHLTARDYWVPVGPPGRTAAPVRFPQGPFRISGHASAISEAPGLDAGDAEWPGAEGDSAAVASDGELAAEAGRSVGPLDGIRILDLTRVWAGPLAGRMLADLGADVIAVERLSNRGPRDVPPEAVYVTHLYPENEVGTRPWNRVAGFNKLMRNRRGVTLDLKDPICHAMFTELVKSSDVVLENYSPRVMGQFGFDFEALREINPHIVYAAMPGYGASGPKKNWVAFGPLIEASAGLTAMMGYADSGPYRSGIAWPDPVAGMNAAAAVVLALHDRDADPERKGREVEVAMVEAMGAFVGEEIVAAQVRGSEVARRGNRDPRYVPQGVYPCAGDDRWAAISVTSDGEWGRFCEAVGLGDELRGLSLAERQERHDEIDAAITMWTRGQTPRGVMTRLQERGVIATQVSDARDLVEDPHLAARDFWAAIDQPDVGPRSYPGNAIRLSRTPVTYRRPAPTLGQHNDEILGGELGFAAEEFARLRESGAIGESPSA